MTKHEAIFLTTTWGPWVRVNYHKLLAAPYEAKSSRKGKTIPFSYFIQHQTDCLLKCTTDKGHWYKISDSSPGSKPFDGVFYRNSPAYYVLSYPRNNFYIVSIHNIIAEFKRQGTRGSITESRARDISIISSK